MEFIRAEWEGDWALHLLAVKQMLPYFFVAGHVHYARYGMIYLRSMEKLDGDVLDTFLKGQHVQCHRDGIWNGLWSDMMIESMFMRFGHGPGGITGVTLNQPAVRCWALSLHICNRLMKDIAELKEETDTAVQSHKEKIPSLVKSDGRNYETIRQKLQQCINPLGGGDELVNIVTRGIYSEKANVNNAVVFSR